MTVAYPKLQAAPGNRGGFFVIRKLLAPRGVTGRSHSSFPPPWRHSGLDEPEPLGLLHELLERISFYDEDAIGIGN